MKKILFTILRIAVSLFLLGFLIWLMRNDLGKVLDAIKKANLFWFASAFLLHVGVIMSLLSLRMQIVYNAADVPVSFRTALELTFIGYFFNNFLPTSMGGDVVKAYYSGKISQKNIASFSAVAIDRLFGLYAIFLLGGVAAGIWFGDMKNKLVAWVLWGILMVFTSGLIFLPFIIKTVQRVTKKLGRTWFESKLELVRKITEYYGKEKVFMARVLGLAVFTKILSVFVVLFLTNSLVLDIPLGVLLWVVPVAFAVTVLPSINGLGIREGAYVYFLGPFVGRENAFALSLLLLGVYLLSDTVGGLIFAFSKEYRTSLQMG